MGLYNAGMNIILTYVGLVFTAMATDYYPRLSGVANDNKEATLMINQQAEIAILILAPILTVFLIFINWVIVILYSSRFTPINDMIHWAALGMYFKAASSSIAFIFLAKGASKLFFWSELITNSYLIVFNILGYKFGGLEGMGISFAISYLLYFLQVYIIARYKYSFSFNNEFLKIFGLQLILGFLCFFIIKLFTLPWSYIAGLIIILLSGWISFKELDKRLGLKSIITPYIKR